MWDAYAAAHPVAVAASPDYTIEHFGDSKRLANELLGVVLSGRKRATAELVADFAARGDQVPRIGSHWVACDGEGLPRPQTACRQLRPREELPPRAPVAPASVLGPAYEPMRTAVVHVCAGMLPCSKRQAAFPAAAAL